MSRSRRLSIPLDEIPCVVRLEDESPPFDWSRLFGRVSPVEIELGAGRGLFLSAAGALHPERSFLGVERAGKYFRHAVYRVDRDRLANVRLARADAFDLLERWVPPGSVEAVHVYFPDPWPKHRHAHRRLLQEALFRGIHQALRGDGTFCFASDVRSYFESAVREILRLGHFTEVDWPSDSPDRIPTSYALKYAREGRALSYAKFRRIEPAGATPTGVAGTESPGPNPPPRE